MKLEYLSCQALEKLLRIVLRSRILHQLNNFKMKGLFDTELAYLRWQPWQPTKII